MIAEIYTLLSSINDNRKAGKNIFSGINLNRKPIRSISSFSSNSIFYFNCVNTDQTMPEEITMISKVLEKSYASFVVSCISLMPFHRVKADDRAAIESYLNQFHQNIGISKPSSTIANLVSDGARASGIFESAELTQTQNFLLECWEIAKKRDLDFIHVVSETVSLNDMYSVDPVDPVTKVIQEQWKARMDELDSWGFIGEATVESMDSLFGDFDTDEYDEDDDEDEDDLEDEYPELDDMMDELDDSYTGFTTHDNTELDELSETAKYTNAQKAFLKVANTKGFKAYMKATEPLTRKFATDLRDNALKRVKVVAKLELEVYDLWNAIPANVKSENNLNLPKMYDFHKYVKPDSKVAKKGIPNLKGIQVDKYRRELKKVKASLKKYARTANESAIDEQFNSAAAQAKLAYKAAKVDQYHAKGDVREAKLGTDYAKYQAKMAKEGVKAAKEAYKDAKRDPSSWNPPKDKKSQYRKVTIPLRADASEDDPDLDESSVKSAVNSIMFSLESVTENKIMNCQSLTRLASMEAKLNKLKSKYARYLNRYKRKYEENKRKGSKAKLQIKFNGMGISDPKAFMRQYGEYIKVINKRLKAVEKRREQLRKRKGLGDTPKADVLPESAVAIQDLTDLDFAIVDRCNECMDYQNNAPDSEVFDYIGDEPNSSLTEAADDKKKKSSDNKDSKRSGSRAGSVKFMDQDMKKANEAIPTLATAQIGFIIDGTDKVETRDVTVGIKVLMHTVPTQDMINDLYNSIINKRKFLRFVKWYSGEERSLADLLFGFKELRTDALNSKSAGSQWTSAFRRRKRWSKMSVPYLMNEYTPNGTVILTMNEVQFIRDEYGLDIMRDDHIKMLMEANFLLGFVILDQANEIAYITYDGHQGNFQQYTYASLEREVSSSDRAIREIYRAMAR